MANCLECINLAEAFIKKDKNMNGCTFIEENFKEKYLSVKEMKEKSTFILMKLREAGMKSGDELVFQIKSSSDFIVTFWACILGNIKAVPVPFFTTDREKSKLIRIYKILKNPYVITYENYYDALKKYFNENYIKFKGVSVDFNNIYISKVIYEKKIEISYPEENDIAFIQFSSGSTDNPKGVALTHKNIMNSIRNMTERAEIMDKNNVLLSWLPLTHDMGLIGMYLTSFLLDYETYIMSPKVFIMDPLLWLHKIEEHKVTLTSAPNFAYKYILRKKELDKLDKLDLSSVKLIFNGGEPVSFEVCSMFMRKMKQFNLKENSIYPVYGLAEATLGVAFPKPQTSIKQLYLLRSNLNIGQKIVKKDSKQKNVSSFVKVGVPLKNFEIKIVDSNRIQLEEGFIGKILIKGNSVMKQYYNNLKQTQIVLTSDGWLDTGDIGVIDEKELAVIGRSKDIIFVNGLNFYSHDIESICEEVIECESVKVAVCGIFNETISQDEVACFITYTGSKEQFKSLSLNLKKNVVKRLGIALKFIIPVESIPCTSSGKIMRYELIKKFFDGIFDGIIKELN